MKIYTLTGDDGTTSLSGGKRVPKSSLMIEACGTIDELIAWIGLLRDLNIKPARDEFMLYIQEKLMSFSAIIASDQNIKTEDHNSGNNCVSVIEEEIDKISGELPVLRNFIIPGGNINASNCHIARCVCRRAERAVFRLKGSGTIPEIPGKFLNRLSDYLFVLARKIVYDAGSEEVKWNNGKA